MSSRLGSIPLGGKDLILLPMGSENDPCGGEDDRRDPN
jgi:hypothetical protein